MQEELLQFKLQKVWILVDLPSGKKAIGTKWVFKNKRDERSIVVKNKARLVAQSAFLYGIIEEEVYVHQPPDFVDPAHPNKVYKERTATTPIESNKPLVKDEDVDVHVYRSMIGSLMYLTTSRSDIMLAVYACARFQVTPKASHLNAVKRIFRVIPQTTAISNIKLPILKKEEYDIWAMEMEHYLEYIDNEDGIVRILSPVTAAEIQAVEKERKAKKYPRLWLFPRAYEKKAVIKQQFEAFKISNTEGLEKGYDRFQQLLSQLEAHGAEVSTEDANHKFSDLCRSMQEYQVIELLIRSSTNIPKKEVLAGFADEIAMIAIRMKKFYKKTGMRVRVDGKTLVGFDKKKLECFNCHNTSHFARECTTKGTHDGKKKRDSFLSHSRSGEANEIYEKDEKLKRYRRIGMKAVKEKEQLQKTLDTWKDSSKNLWRLINSGMSSNSKVGLGFEIQSNNEVLSYEEEMNFSVFKCSKEDSIGKPLYSRFTKTNDFKGVPHPLSGDYTPSPQDEIDESLYVYGKKGPQEPEPSVSDDRSSEFSTCQSNDSAGSIGTSSEHSVDLESEISRVPSEVTNINFVRPRVNAVSSNVNTVRSRQPEHPLKNMVDRGIFDSGCSGHMTGNKDQLEDFEEFNGGSVTFGGSKGYISGKGKIRVDTLSVLGKFDDNSVEDKPNVKGVGYRWMFDIDYLTDSMNYIPVSLENQANPHAGYITEEKVKSRTSSTNSKKEEILRDPQQERKVSSTDTLEDNPKIQAFRRELEEIALKHLGEVPGKQNSTMRGFVSQPLVLLIPDHPKKVYKVVKALYGLHQAPRACSMGELTFFLGLQVKQNKAGIFISQDKYVAEILKKFDLVNVKAAITPMETKVALTKDEEAIDVDVYLYRSMIVTPKISHLNAVKGIFKYLKGKPNLGLWYPRESPFDLEAFSDSAYDGSTLKGISTTAEYVAAANCCGQVLWVQNQLLDYGFNFMNTKNHIDNESTICIVKNLVYHSKTKHIKIRHHFIRDCYEKKLISVEKIHTDLNVADLLTKPFDGPRFNYLVVSIGFAEIVDFLRGFNLRYALTSNPTIYDSLVKQFWQTATANTIADGTLEIHATINTIGYTITDASIRDKLQLADAIGNTMLPNDEIFERMGQMGYPTDGTFTFWKCFFTPQWRYLVHHLLHCISSKSGGWDQFSSNIATALICLSTDRVYNFSKLIFDGMVANLKSKMKFLMYPRFLQLILDIQTENKHPYLAVTLTKKIFRNMKRGFRGAPWTYCSAMLFVATTQPICRSRTSCCGINLTLNHPPLPVTFFTSSPPVKSPPPTSTPTPTPLPCILYLHLHLKLNLNHLSIPLRSHLLSNNTSHPHKNKPKLGFHDEVDMVLKELSYCEGINTGSIKVSTVSEQVSTGSTKRSISLPDKGQREGKAPMIVEEAPKKSKEQILQEEASLAEAIRLDTLQKRMAKQAKIEANAELSKSMLGSDLQGEDFAKKMVDLGTWKLSQLKNLSFEEVKEEFDKLVKQVESFAPINFEATKASLKRFGEELQTKTSKRLKSDEAKDDEPTKKSGKRYMIVTNEYGMDGPEDEIEKVFWKYLKNMFEEPLSTDPIWSALGQQRIISWRYYDTCRVHCLNLESMDIYMLIERKYPLSAKICKAMLDKKLQGGKPDEDCYKMLKMMEKQAGIRK
ncbi:putative ribonuclease H-like domain-containing protein [Tanacetum coccineum]